MRDMTVNPYRPGAVPFDMPDYIPEALAVVATGGTIERNEHGCWQSVHVCSACDERFTVCPPSATWGDLCKAPDCASYEEPQDGPFTGVHVRIDLAAIADNYVIHECDPADATHLVVPRPAVAATS